MCDPILRPHQLQLVAAAGLGFQQHFMDRGAGEFEGVTQVVAEQQAREEQPRGQVTDPDRLPREGQQRALQVPDLVGGHQ